MPIVVSIECKTEAEIDGVYYYRYNSGKVFVKRAVVIILRGIKISSY